MIFGNAPELVFVARRGRVCPFVRVASSGVRLVEVDRCLGHAG